MRYGLNGDENGSRRWAPSDEQIVELFFVITTYRMHGMMLRELHLEFDDDATARMEEVPGPAVNMQDVPGAVER